LEVIVSDLIVLAFDSEEGAIEARDKLLSLENQGALSLSDAAVVVRRADGEVKVKQVKSMTGAGAAAGGILGLIIGLFFLAPWLGMAVGVLGGAVVGKRTDFGIDDDFIKEVGETIGPGHSALFLQVYRAADQKVMPVLEQFDATVLRTTLSLQDEAKLREALGEKEVPSD
jgi:uncharacterized membrane protein